MSVTVIGSCMIDLVCYAEKLPKPGETIHGTNFIMGHGGKGANQCIAAAKLGAKVSLIARLGDDSFGREYKESLSKSGIDTSHVNLTPNISSGMAQITVSDKGENQIVIVAGANNKLALEDVERAEGIIAGSKVFLFQFETPLTTTLDALRYIKRINSDSITVVNAAPAIKNFDVDLFNLSDIFCVNETEAEELCSIRVRDVDEAKHALVKMIEMGCNTVIITLGKNGAVFNQSKDKSDLNMVHVSTQQVVPVDTTGAGDAFLGALAFYLSDYGHLPLATQVQRACSVASVSVTKKGTQSSYPLREELPQTLFS